MSTKYVDYVNVIMLYAKLVIFVILLFLYPTVIVFAVYFFEVCFCVRPSNFVVYFQVRHIMGALIITNSRPLLQAFY